jgi:hypothetical protein
MCHVPASHGVTNCYREPLRMLQRLLLEGPREEGGGGARRATADGGASKSERERGGDGSKRERESGERERGGSCSSSEKERDARDSGGDGTAAARRGHLLDGCAAGASSPPCRFFCKKREHVLVCPLRIHKR